MDKKVAILWSGGLDSTYLIYKNLLEGNTVYAYYIEINNNINKVIKEKEAMESLTKLFIDKYGTAFDNRGTLVYIDVNTLYGNCLIFSQMPIWITALQFIGNVDEIQIGYCMNDDAISYLDDIKNIHHSFSSIKTKEIPISFPLSKIKKEEELNFLPEEYKKLIWYCENPINNKPCHECCSCKRYNSIGFIPKYDKIEKDQVKEQDVIKMSVNKQQTKSTKKKIVTKSKRS